MIGAGPGLGMSIAHRFGREGYEVALVSRSVDRHAGYLESLAAAGIVATAHVADVLEDGALSAVTDELQKRERTIEMAYYGPAAVDLDDAWPEPITLTDQRGAYGDALGPPRNRPGGLRVARDAAAR